MSSPPLASLQDRVRLLPGHRGRVHGHLVRRRPAAGAEPEGAAAPNLRDEIRSTRRALELPTVGGRQPSAKQFADLIGTAEDATDARVTVRDWQRQRSKDRNPGFYPVDDSEEPVPFDEDLARRALMSRHVLRAYGTFRDEQIGMIAQPIKSPGRRARLAFYSIGFEDVQTTVAFVRDRVLIATASRS